METFIWTGRIVLVVVAIANTVETLYRSHRFEQYLKERHPEHWERIFYGRPNTRTPSWALVPGAPAGFLWRSREDLGDAMVAELRRQIQRVGLGTISSWIAVGVWFVISGIIM